jgi:Glycosyl hydrolase family 59/Galactocerebrosidase, C-terminal lectin domain
MAVGLTCVLAVTGAIAAGHALTTKSGPGKPQARRSGITINGARVGPAFQGVGAISGGGGNSRLIVDYPAKQQRQILDYLFKPGYGASLQILKVEIGGEAYATDGAEPSFEHVQGRQNCRAGYELWLAHQARMRNPNIQLVALQWNAPRWVGGRSGNPWSLTDIGYVIDWLKCARSDYGLRFNYVGGWNEHLPHGITAQVMGWFIRLRAALDRNGFGGVRIIAVDSFAHLHNGKDVSNFLSSHPAFRRAIGVLGYHNLCKYPATGNHCRVTHAARASGKPIWESEIGALRQGTGIGAMTRSIDNAYIEVRATGLVAWPLMGSMPAYLPEEDRGLLFADEPWSGQFHVQPMTWVIAQTTQFTAPGWRHVNGAAGHLNGSSSGSYATYEAPDHSAWTMVAQTSDAPVSQTITVNVDRGLPRSVVHVWSTNIRAHNARSWFVHRGDVRLTGGSFRYVLRPGYIYTFTTVRRPGKGTAVSPRSRTMPLPYTDKPDIANEPRYLGAQDGAFEYIDAKHGIFAQTAVGAPVFWQNPVSTRFPYAVIGFNGMRNYTVSVQARFTAPGQSAGLITRFDHPKANGVAQQFDGYQFIVAANGSWKLLKDEPRKPPRLMRAGKLAKAPGVHNWATLQFAVHRKLLVCKVNGKQVVAVRDSTYSFGDAGISTSGWYQVQFQHLRITK